MPGIRFEEAVSNLNFSDNFWPLVKYQIPWLDHFAMIETTAKLLTT